MKLTTLNSPKAYALLKSLSISDKKIDSTLLSNNPAELEVCKGSLGSLGLTDSYTLPTSKVNRDVKLFKESSQILRIALMYHAKHQYMDCAPITDRVVQEFFGKPIPVDSPVRLLYAAGASDYHVSKVMGLNKSGWVRMVCTNDKIKKDRFAGRVFFICKLVEPIILASGVKKGARLAEKAGFNKEWTDKARQSLMEDYGWDGEIPAALFGEDIPSIHYYL